jgi:hypothetical protein
MDTYIANSAAAHPLGLPTQQKCLRMTTGRYAGRVVILYASSASSISLVWADAPYDAFSEPAIVVTNIDDAPFDAYMNDGGDIYIAYTVSSSKSLGFVLLTHTDGSWSAGSPAAVYDGDECYYPSIHKFASGDLWIAYTRLSGGVYYISAKVSDDDGASWGIVSNPGDTLTAGSSSAYSVQVETGSYQYVFYSDGGSTIGYRRMMQGAVVWSSEVVLATGSGYDERLAAAVSDDGRIGVAYADGDSLKFREYSGSTWSGEYVVDDNPVDHPALSYQGGVPYLLFSRDFGFDRRLVMYSKMTGAIFQSPLPLDGRKSYLSGTVVYDASAGTSQDKTDEAISQATADVFHSTSGALLAAAGDTAYFGMNEPFHVLSLVLSTVGVGGEVAWKYWDGQAWKAFDPVSGPWHLISADKTLLLWDDFRHVPADWQKKTIMDKTLYWIGASVITAFTMPPVGSQISACTELAALSLGV